MRVLIDREGIQSRHHLRDNMRLSALITRLISAGHPVLLSRGSVLTGNELDHCDVLLMTTRRPGQYPEQENRRIREFVWRGGGLMLMSNHRDDRKSEDLTLHAAQLARDCQFGVIIERTFFKSPQEGKRTRMCGDALNTCHPIMAGARSRDAVRSIVTNTCCSLTTIDGHWLARLPEGMRDKLDGSTPDGRHFAVALQAGRGLAADCMGRVVAVADSGFIGSDGTAYPGVGLAGQGDNMRFVLNALAWLAGELEEQPGVQ